MAAFALSPSRSRFGLQLSGREVNRPLLARRLGSHAVRACLYRLHPSIQLLPTVLNGCGDLQGPADVSAGLALIEELLLTKSGR